MFDDRFGIVIETCRLIGASRTNFGNDGVTSVALHIGLHELPERIDLCAFVTGGSTGLFDPVRSNPIRGAPEVPC